MKSQKLFLLSLLLAISLSACGSGGGTGDGSGSGASGQGDSGSQSGQRGGDSPNENAISMAMDIDWRAHSGTLPENTAYALVRLGSRYLPLPGRGALAHELDRRWKIRCGGISCEITIR